MGDGDNDAEFLAAAGQCVARKELIYSFCIIPLLLRVAFFSPGHRGIAMLNGTAMAKQAASRDSECTNEQHGVAHELRRIFAELLERPAV